LRTSDRAVSAGCERSAGRLVVAAVLVALAVLGGGGCGARTGLDLTEPCEDGVVEACGSDVGACRKGTRTCVDFVFGPCEGEISPVREACNDIDDDCDGGVDEDFHVGEACDGPDSDSCLDDVMSCAGCSHGPDVRETCNGVDDDCDGVVDADCESGSCSPTLVVTGSVPSSPSCVDFPVEAGSTGGIQYPCGGGMVTAQLGSVPFTGTVQDGVVSLDGSEIIGADRTPDGCVWQMTHHISGRIGSGQLTYSYGESYISGSGCWRPCTETGTVEIRWAR
jgi:hypothetical protein